jgi:hypothetical protein
MKESDSRAAVLAAVDEARLDLEAAAEREHRARLAYEEAPAACDRGDGGEPRMWDVPAGGPQGGCGGNAERRFDLVLDDPPSLTVAGVVQGVEGSSLALAKGAR